MKKFWIALLLLSFSFSAYASIADKLVIQEKNVTVHFSTTVPANVTSAFVLVGLSTTTGLFPHTDRGELDVSGINVTLDKVAAATATVRIGVVNFVNNSTGSVTFFYTRSSVRNVSNTNGGDALIQPSSFFRCKVKSGATATNTDVDGLTPFLLSNEKRSGSSIYRSTTTANLQLNSPVGLVSPAVGDIVMEVLTDATNAVNVIVDLLYHSEP